MPSFIDVSFHRWPWSVDVDHESVFADGDSVNFKFYGSPVISVMGDAQVLLPVRQEKFIPLGPAFQKKTKVYEAPHGILSQQSIGQGEVMILSTGKQRSFILEALGAKGRKKDDGKTDTALACKVLGWSQIFDDMVEHTSKMWAEQGIIPWKIILEFFKEQRDELQKPRRSLIVGIAEALSTSLPGTVSGMRRILLRERNLQKINRISETDVRSLQWYIRQPGASMAEKGGNRQELMAVVRRESFDVLENRVLKDFLCRCGSESLRYINGEVDFNPQFRKSKRALDVTRFREICMGALKHRDFEGVPRAGGGVIPNYVLQNDLRYRNIWTWYRRLLRKEEDEDRLWDWQARTWADIARLLVNLAIVWLNEESLSGETTQENAICIRQRFESSLHVVREQVLGCRINSGSEPGPYIIERLLGGRKTPVAILEVVHPDEAYEHDVVQNIGRTGGHLYLVIRPLDNSFTKSHVLILWAVNSAGSHYEIPWEDISSSADDALRFHRNALMADRIRNLPVLHGLVVASSLSARQAGVVQEDSNAPVVTIHPDSPQWHDGIEFLATLLLERLDRLI